MSDIPYKFNGFDDPGDIDAPSKHYGLHIDCENEQDAQQVAADMAAWTGKQRLWFPGQNGAQRWEVRTSPVGLLEALLLYAECDRRYERVNLQSYVIELSADEDGYY